MGGILKNALSQEEQILKEQTANESISEFRQKVYTNTQLNAKLTGKNLLNNNTAAHNAGADTEDTTNDHTSVVTGGGKFVPKDTLLMKREQKRRESQDGMTEEERLQWNQENLAENEITKQQFQDIHVDEPKTPYQGAVDPNGEYYNVDDEDNLNEFSLGEPEIEIPREPHAEFEQDDDEEEEEEEEEDAEARHKRFEEMRKKHYDVRAVFHKK